MVDLSKSIGVLLPALRISFALALLTGCLLLSADLLGIVPKESKFLLGERKKLSEALAVQFAIFAPDQDPKKIQKMLGHIVKRTPDIESAGIRLHNGQLIFQIGDHQNKWEGYDKEKSTTTHLIVPILQHNEPWGKIELKFFPLGADASSKFYIQSNLKLILYVLLLGFFVYLAFMIRALRILDPSSVIPDRVNSAFDTLSEGIIILDEQEQIVLANKAFTEKLLRPAASFLGLKLSTLKWKDSANNSFPLQHSYPWQKVLKTGKRLIGVPLMLASNDQNNFKFIINASPIQNSNSETEGVLITFDDVTELEKNHFELQEMVNRLETTQAHIEQQNKELNFLATKDPLTGCLNRRAFNMQFEQVFEKARQNNTALSFIMADIDHFKKVNDKFGHAAGDDVIKLFAEIIQSNIRQVDFVGRYGGEEFSIVMPGMDDKGAFALAERIRLRLKTESEKSLENGPRVTASFGVSSLKDYPETAENLQLYADEALFAAKESGRNRVLHWLPRTGKIAQEINPVEISNELEQINNRPEDTKELQLRVIELESIASQFSAELEYTKNYDSLTGLPNHILFYDRINQVIERGNRYDQSAAILVIDIGLFGHINATFGRSYGDKVLTEISERIKNTFRKYDAVSRLTISRFGGDEFAVLLTDLSGKETVTWIVMRLQETLAEPIDIDGNKIFITNHIGISLYPSDAKNVEDLIKSAMLAKKHSKQYGQESHYQFFDDQMQKLSLKHVNLDRELRDSIRNEYWLLLYQPKMDIKTQSIVGVEALIRWQHPTRGILSPYEFIDFAEQRGLILPIGDWVIKTACMQAQKWMSQHIECTVSVNVSALQLKEEDFVGKIIRTLAAYRIPPRLIELEVTESTLMNNFEVALQSLKRLSKNGIKIAIDDFGTGYSSLGYLKNLPIDTLKIDRIFIKDICNDDNDKQIVKALISMAHSLNMKVVAEGVEDKEQFDLLTKYGCDEIQGYLLSKPIPSEALTDMLVNHIQHKF
jgi:diguanylate cyclase (GGDEF)-like protein